MADRRRVVLTDFLQSTEIEAPLLDDLADLVLVQAHHEADLAPYLADADVLIAYHDIARIGPDTFDQAPRCLGIVRAGVGFNNIDIEAAGRAGIVACNVPDYGTEEVADHAIMLLLAVARHLVIADSAIRRGVWDYRLGLDTPRLKGRTLGLVGCGRIGTATALRAKAFGLDVAIYDPFAPAGFEKAIGVRRAESLGELLGQSHFLSIHCYLDPSTHRLIDAEALRLMPRGGILINTARGGVVDQSALVDALDSGHLLGAGLDVCEHEPLADDRLRNHPRVILTPHSAFYSVEGFAELRRKAAEEARRLLLGRPPRCPVNRQYLIEPRAFLGGR